MISFFRIKVLLSSKRAAIRRWKIRVNLLPSQPLTVVLVRDTQKDFLRCDKANLILFDEESLIQK